MGKDYIKILAAILFALAVACQSSPIPTLTPTPTPLWSEGQAIAIMKTWCLNGGLNSYSCRSKLSDYRDIDWSSEYDSVEQRWTITMIGQFFLNNTPSKPIVSYVYESTNSFEWYVNK